MDGLGPRWGGFRVGGAGSISHTAAMLDDDLVTVTAEPVDSAHARQLIDDLGADLLARYGEADPQFGPLDPDVVADGGVFLVARDGGRPVGCAAILRTDEALAEVKRVYVESGARGRGIGLALMAELERQARGRGYRRLRLETGDGQPEAVGLYARCGYEVIPCWGRYADRGWSICMAKDVG